jgi:hypothetical protein
MRVSHLGWGQGCLLIVVALAACGSPAASMTEAIPTEATGAMGAAGPTPGPALAPTSQAIEEVLLHQVAERICPYPDNPEKIDPYERYFTAGDPKYSFICYPAMGHSITVTMERFADAARAGAGFPSATEPGPAKELDGFPVADWQEHHPSFPGGRYEYRVRLLQVGHWLIWIRSFDDTHFLIAPDPHEASLAILQVFREHGLPHTAGEPP